MSQGDVWWADLPPPGCLRAGVPSAIVFVQCNAFNRSRLRTVLCVPLTTNLTLSIAPGNVLLQSDSTGLPQDSVANVSQILAIDRTLLQEQTGRVSDGQLQLIFDGFDVVLGR